MNRLGPDASESVLKVVLTNLPQLTRNSQPQYQNTLNILWPIADKILANASTTLLVQFASIVLPHLSQNTQESDSSGTHKDSKEQSDGTPVLASKFGISVIVGLLVRGEQEYSEMIKHHDWQEFLSRVIDLLANIPNPSLITDTLVRDSGSGSGKSSTGTPPVVVLSRGQSLSSLTKQRSVATVGRLTPPLPMIAVTAGNGCNISQPSAHLARCTEQAHSEALAAAQSTLQRLEITPEPLKIRGVEVVTISADNADTAINRNTPITLVSNMSSAQAS